jgi:hypothetical protein
LPYIIAFVLIIFLISLIFTYWQISLTVVGLILAIIIVPRIVRNVRKNRYFNGEVFLAQKSELAAFVDEHNELAEYIAEIRERDSFQLAVAETGRHAHLATFQNTSAHKHRRDRNQASFDDPNVHNCSLQVVRSASGDPLKYLMKYFNIAATEGRLTEVETLGEDIARLEDAVANLRQRETAIVASFHPPAFILKHYEQEFRGHVGYEVERITIPYPVYVFEYVSAGGNSSQRTSIKLNNETIDELVDVLAGKIRFDKSAAGQRALMTARLRQFIKARDGHACRYCSVSIVDEPHLLLEVDHIVPVSKGGLSTHENLQTLCWRCNRTKSNKIVAV